MKKHVFILVLCSLFVLKSCKSTQTAVTKNTAGTLTNLSSKKVIANHYKTHFEYTTLRAKLKVNYDDGKKSFSPTVSLRMQKDKMIWLSAKVFGIVVGKILISPTKVQYYEVVNNTYFDGDFSLLSKLLGAPLDFENVQNLLIGAPIVDLQNEKHTITIQNLRYLLRPKAVAIVLQKIFEINPNTYTLAAQQLQQPSENRTLAITYPEYQNIENQRFPKAISINATRGQKLTTIDIDYKDVAYNAKVSFPFHIPSGAKQIQAK